jgi:hypothetical protein
MPESGIFPIFLRAEYRNDGEGFSRFQSDAARAAAQAKREFQGVAAALDDALSRPRNSVGSLDLGLDELRQAAIVQQQIAAAAREVADATNRARAAATGYDAQLSKSTQAAFKLAQAEESRSREMLEQIQILERVQAELNQTASATDEVIQAQRRGTTARGNVINSVRAERVAFIQLGQQLQDVTVQAQLGTNAFLIFGQQVPQAAFALSGLSESSNETLAKVGEFATFLSGPWGAALFAATAFLGPLVFEMLGFGDATEEATQKTFNFVEGLDILSLSTADATAAMDQLGNALSRAITLQGDFLRGEIDIARQSLTTLQAQIAADESEISRRKAQERQFELFPGLLPSSPNNLGNVLQRRALEERLAQNRALLPTVAERAATASIAEANRNVAEAADPLLAKINDVDEAIARLNERRRSTVVRDDVLAEGNLSQSDFERQLGQLSRERASLEEQRREAGRNPRTRRGARERVNREPDQLARFADQAAERVARINERFDEQPRLIDQAAQATRELESIIAETNQRMERAKNLTAAQRDEFEGIKTAAEEAKGTIEDALLRPFEQLRQESEQRLQIETALANGQVDRAAALQEIFRLEQQIGDLSEDQKRDVEDIVVAEQQRLRVLRDQREVFEAQLDVLSTVRRDLTDILSGRSADFFGNFRQALQDLQGQRLFEKIFGDTFREIEEELQGNTPQGRANKALADQTNKTADTMEIAQDAVADLTEAFVGAAAAFRNGGIAANDNSAGGAASLLGPTGLGGIINAALGAVPSTGGGITVTSNRARPTDISRGSITDLAERISRGIGESIGVELEEVFGPRFAGLLGDIVGGAIAGQVTGGTTGAVLGGLGALAGNIKGLEGVSSALGKAGAGAGVGTQVAGLSKALGLGGSTTGAQIGGAIGSFIPIPGGDIIGAIAGNIIGSLIKGTPRGSATIGGVGDSLGVTGISGNRGSLKEAAGTLAGSVIEAIDNIAEQLGATVNSSAGRVSIGQRKDSLRVDPSGRGATKIGNGAIDFGDDAEAAIAFAVRDLINDGVITGLRQSEQNLLRAGDDVEAALRDVLEFRSVFDRLEEIRDPLGGAIRRLNTEFEGLIDLFERAGASTEEFADLEELYNLERARAIKEASDRVIGSLRDLLNDLTIGDSGLSLRDRRSNAVGQFDALAARVASGDTSAFDDFADISQQLLDIERQLFGSTQSYFDRLQQVTSLTEAAIADQTNVTSIGAGQPSPFDERNNIARAIESTSAEQVSILQAINDNLVLALGQGPRAISGGGERYDVQPFPFSLNNF